jgi:histidine triad (HIT) family protein
VDCIFCKIIAGGVPSQKVYENEMVLAILDINPIAFGHTLVIPRAHRETFNDLPPDVLGELVIRAQQVARGVVRATGAQGFNLLMNNGKCSGQAIAHAHFHLIPRKDDDGVRFNWQPRKYGDGELEKMAANVREALK